MVLQKIYWIFIGLILVLIILQIIGYQVIEIIFLLVLSTLILLEIIRAEEHENIGNILKNDIYHRLVAIEKVLNYIFKNISNSLTLDHLDIFHNKLVKTLETRENFLKQKLKEDLEIISRKIIEVENRISELKNRSSTLHKRIENIENYLFEEEL